MIIFPTLIVGESEAGVRKLAQMEELKELQGYYYGCNVALGIG